MILSSVSSESRETASLSWDKFSVLKAACIHPQCWDRGRWRPPRIWRPRWLSERRRLSCPQRLSPELFPVKYSSVSAFQTRNDETLKKSTQSSKNVYNRNHILFSFVIANVYSCCFLVAQCKIYFMLKGLCHEMNILLKAHKIKSVLFVWAPMVLKFFAAWL